MEPVLPNPLPRLYRLYRRSRPGHRLVARTAEASERFRQEAWGWATPAREAWVLDALRGTLQAAADGAPFYRERLQRAGVSPARLTFDEFARLPPLDRTDIAENWERMLLADPDDSTIRRDSTGGSTGQPTAVWKGPAERAWAEGGVNFFMRRSGIPFGARTAFLWGHHLDAAAKEGWKNRVRNLRDNVSWFDCFRLSPEILLAHHARLNRLRPDCVIAYGGALAELARVVEGSGQPPRYPRIAFVTGAEKVWAHERERIERVFGVPVWERYGSRDVGLMAFQAQRDAGDGFDVDWPNMLVEPETSDPESAILVTKLHADAFPMLRYRIGDRARFPAPSRPGHPAVRLAEILGRELEMIRIGEDRWLSGANFPHMFKDYPVTDFQVHQHADGSVEVRIVPTAATTWTADVRSRFDRALHTILGDTPTTVRFVGEIPRTVSNKRRPVISELARRPR
jgi:phenylacetate-CoA ligase